MSQSFFEDNDDLRWYLDRGVDWAPMVELTEYGFRAEDGFTNPGEAVEFYGDVLEAIGQFAAREVAPRAAAMDRNKPTLEDGLVKPSAEMQHVFDTAREMELFGLTVPRELGGTNAPVIVYQMASELLARADVSVMTHFAFHGGIAMALLMYSIHEGSTEFDVDGARIADTRFRKEIEEIVRGEAWGCMDITEPDAGSDMARLRARAVQADDGSWTVTGSKIFITSGHGKYHVVIARTEVAEDPDDPFAGLKGLSLFLVPLYEDGPDGRTWHGTVERLEEKLGHNGSATCVINFEDTPGRLIGQRGEGFRLMLLLMNNARIGVGFESIGLCEAAHRAAVEYAAQRPSMGKTIDRHEMIADYLDEMRTDIQGLRALGMHCAYHEELNHKLKIAGKLLPADRRDRADALEADARRHSKIARRGTPLFKYLAAEKAVEMARRCMQIHGGVGYTKEYGAEKLLRDSLVMPIYEGTSQIQALMAMKDALLAVMKNPQGFLKDVARARWRSVSVRDPLERRVARLQALELSAKQQLLQRTAARKLRGLGGKPVQTWTSELFKSWDPKRDFAPAQLHAERLTRIMADVHICEVLWEQTGRDSARREVLERYLERAEPRCRMLAEVIATTGDRILAGLRGAEEQEESADRAAQ